MTHRLLNNDFITAEQQRRRLGFDQDIDPRILTIFFMDIFERKDELIDSTWDICADASPGSFYIPTMLVFSTGEAVEIEYTFPRAGELTIIIRLSNSHDISFNEVCVYKCGNYRVSARMFYDDFNHILNPLKVKTFTIAQSTFNIAQ